MLANTMKQTVALAEMLGAKDCTLLRDKDFDLRSRERMEGEMDRVRTRERLEATIAGIGELEYLRQRQELLVRSVLNYTDIVGAPSEDKHCHVPEENYLNTEEKLLGENILLLRKQLNCLRKRDAGLITQLQELDRQISDLRLDAKPSHEHVETDSRPSSGFYELSDGASGSLSNSSNSVFSECLSSCHSGSCFCSPLDTSLCASDGQPKSADEDVCTECEGTCEDQSSGTVRRSLSAPYSPSSEDGQVGKYHCDLMARNGNDIYRYPSPLHAVAVQSPIYFQSLANQLKDDMGLSKSWEAQSDGGQKVDTSTSGMMPVAVPQSTSWPTPSGPPIKRLDSYIFGLLQRRAQPMRPNKPRTSISTDPSKSILRQASLCVRQASTGQAPGGWTMEVKPNWQACVQAGVAPGMEVAGIASPQRKWSVETKGELAESLTSVSSQVAATQPQNCFAITQDVNSNSLLKKNTSMSGKGQLLMASLSIDSEDAGSPATVLSPRHTKQLYSPAMEARQPATQVVKSATPKKASKSAPSSSPPLAATVASLKDDRSTTLERVSLGSSSQSQDEGGHMVSAQYIPAQKQAAKLRKGGGKNVKIVKVKGTATSTAKSRCHGELTVDTVPPAVSTEIHRDRQRSGTKKPRHVEDPHHHAHHSHRSSRKTSSHSSRAKRIPASIPEGRILDKHMVSTHRSTTGNRHHGHHGHHHGHRDPVVVAKPKHKRNDYRRLRAIAEVPYEEAFRRAHRRQKRELLSQMANMYLPSNAAFTSPYAYVGSDSEYSAECASLFHSTIMDTSEDEQSNYTTNCFGDSESSNSEAEYVEESTTTSDSEESAGANWPQFSQGGAGSVHPQEMTTVQAKAFVKIKASHNLKKRILRFRSGSLKLMTTV